MSKAFVRLMAMEYIDWFPGFLRCELIDRNGKKHEFIEKIPTFCGADSHFSESSLYPVEITFQGKLLSNHMNEGNEWFVFSTKEPYDVSSEEGLSEFQVNRDQLIIPK